MKKGMWVAVLALLAALAGPAAAQDNRGIYLGGSGGYVLYDHSCEGLIAPCDDDNVGWRAYGGYRFNRHWSAELGYAKLKESRAEAVILGQPSSRTVRAKDIFDLTGLLQFGIVNRLDGFVRLGVYHGRLTIDEEIPADPTLETHQADTNLGWTVGAGLQYNLGFIGVRAEWQTYGDIGPNGAGGQDNIHVFSIGALIQF